MKPAKAAAFTPAEVRIIERAFYHAGPMPRTRENKDEYDRLYDKIRRLAGELDCREPGCHAAPRADDTYCFWHSTRTAEEAASMGY